MRRRLLVLIPSVVVGATAALLASTGTATAAPPPTTTGKTYVALGDSYAAGFGIPATATTPDGTAVAATGKPVVGCAQTTGDYPHQVATTLGLTLTDITCSGAVTDDFYAPQDVTAGPKPAAQLDIFKTVQPDLVTVTIGGNDLGFSSIAQACLAATANGPLLAHPGNTSCQAYFAGAGKADDPYAKLPAVLAKVDAALKAVHTAAPNAKIAVIAYPAIAPDVANTPAGGCFAANALAPGAPLPSALPFTDADIPYLQVLQQQLDNGIGATAAADGAAYADIYPSSLSHSACQPESARWVEPLIPDQVVAPGSTNVLHPNVKGTAAMAAALAPVVTTLFAPPATTTPPAPTTTSPAGSGATTVLAGAPTLAATGTRMPVSVLVGLAAGLMLAGGAAVRLGRRSAARH